MGQKVNPVGFRLGVKSNRKLFYKNKITQDKTDIFDRKAFFNFAPKRKNVDKNYGKNIHQNLIIKNYVYEIFTKSGYFISHFFIDESKDELVIKLDVFSRSGTSKQINFNKVRSQSGFMDFFNGSSKGQDDQINEQRERRNPEGKQEKKESKKKQLNIGSEIRRKRSWTNRRLKWRDLNEKDLKFFSKFIEKTVCSAKGVRVKWKIRLLNKNLNYNTNLIKKLFRNLGRSKRQPFFNDGINIFALVLNEPQAPLLAEQIAYELSQLRKHANQIQFIKEGLSIGLEKDVFSSSALRVPEGVNTEKNAKIKDEPSVNLLGFLIQIKGRINGSDRSRRLKYRIGSVPLHTINAPIDQAFSEALTTYGKCSVKVWLKQA